MVPIIAAFTPLPAVGLPPEVKGGQALWQAPEQLLMLGLSASNKYSVRPCASTRILPRLVFRTSTVELAAEPVLADDAGAVLPPVGIEEACVVLLLSLLLLPQPLFATAIATTAATPVRDMRV